MPFDVDNVIISVIGVPKNGICFFLTRRQNVFEAYFCSHFEAEYMKSRTIAASGVEGAGEFKLLQSGVSPGSVRAKGTRESGVWKSLLRLTFAVLFALGLLAGGRAAVAQNGSIQGIVVDAQGAVIANATVKATDTAKGVVVRQVTTNANGEFQLTPLGASTYTIEVNSTGMNTLQRQNIILGLSQDLNLGQVPLAVGSEATTVTVDIQPSLVETTTSEHSDVITSKEVTETPLNGRDFSSLIRTLPGIVSTSNTDFNLAFNSTTGFYVNGYRSSANNVYLDGAINTDVGANDGQYTQLSLDAVGEFKVLSGNYNAEYGRSPGVNIQINTKSGTRQFHGTVYEFNRNDFFDANKYDLNHTGTRISKLRFNQFGANIGGPVLIPKFSSGDHKKLFFFYNYEGTRATRPNPAPTTGRAAYDLPAPAQLTGDFSSAYKTGNITFTGPDGISQIQTPYQIGQIFVPGSIKYNSLGQIMSGTPYAGNILPAAQFSKQAPAWQKLLGRGYTFGPNTPVNLDPSQVEITFQDSYQFTKNQNAVRIDYAANDKLNMFFRWVDDSQRESQQFGIFGYNAFPILPEFREKPGASWAFGINNIITPSLTNEAIFQFNHLTQRVDVNTPAANYDQTALGFNFQQLYPGTNLRNKYPQFTAGGFFDNTFAPGWHSEGRTLGVTDTLSKIIGAHTLKAGGFVNEVKSGQQPSFTEAANFNFSGGQSNINDTNNAVANLLLGNYQSVSQSNGIYFGSFKFWQWEIFGQDTYRITPRLTIDYGLRYAYLGPTYTYGKYLQNYFDPSRYNPATAAVIQTAGGVTAGSIIGGDPFNGIVQEGTQGIPKGLAQHRYNNFQPRVGFAYDVFGDGKTAFRAGAGIFNERIRQNNQSFDGLGNPPLSYTPQLFNGNIDNLSPALVASGTRFPVNINAFDKAGQVPTYYGYNMGIQQQLPHNVVLSMTYVGNTGRHEQYSYNLNQLQVGAANAIVNSAGQSLLQSVGQQANAIVPYKGYTSIFYTKYGATSNYNGLQTQIQRRFSRDLVITADYTWSKTIDLTDDDDNISELIDTYHPARDRAVAGWDRTNVFNSNFVYTAPDFRGKGFVTRSALGGWELSGIIRYWSGLPFSVFANGNPGTLGPTALNNPGNSGSGNVYANYNPQAGHPLYTRTYTQWFDPTLFSRPADNTLGNTSRNQFRGPGIANWNISIYKNFLFTESTRLQLRLDTFNTFNHTQFVGLFNSVSANNSGQAIDASNRSNSGGVASTFDARNLQLAAKFFF